VEAIVTVKFGIPDEDLQATLDHLLAEGASEGEYSLKSLFKEHLDDWISPSPYIHVNMTVERMPDSS